MAAHCCGDTRTDDAVEGMGEDAAATLQRAVELWMICGQAVTLWWFGLRKTYVASLQTAIAVGTCLSEIILTFEVSAGSMPEAGPLLSCFEGHPSLRNVHLSGLAADGFHHISVRHMPCLEAFFLAGLWSDDDDSWCDVELLDLPQLASLTLRFCNLKEIPFCVWSTPSLRHLSLACNSIS